MAGMASEGSYDYVETAPFTATPIGTSGLNGSSALEVIGWYHLLPLISEGGVGR